MALHRPYGDAHDDLHKVYVAYDGSGDSEQAMRVMSCCCTNLGGPHGQCYCLHCAVGHCGQLLNQVGSPG